MIGDAERGFPTAVFGADPDVGRDLAQVDWAATPLGSPSGWPQSLQTAVSILLSSPVPDVDGVGAGADVLLQRRLPPRHTGPQVSVGAGPAGERGVVGDLGRHRTANRPGAVHGAGHLGCGAAAVPGALRLPRGDLSHVLLQSVARRRGDMSSACCAWSARTPHQVIGERRMATLRDLGSDPSVVRTEEESLAFAHRQLGQNLRDLPFTLTYLFDDDGDARLAGPAGSRRGTRPPPPCCLPTALRSGRSARLARGESVLVELDGAPYSDLPTGDWPEPPVKALVVPLHGAGRHVQWLSGGRAEPVPPDKREVTPASWSWSPRTSRRESAAPAATGPSSGGPRSWPNWIAPRPRSSPTSATSSAPR